MWKNFYWIHVSQDRDQRRDFVKLVMNFHITQHLPSRDFYSSTKWGKEVVVTLVVGGNMRFTVKISALFYVAKFMYFLSSILINLPFIIYVSKDTESSEMAQRL
jgi:hypothetical protein